MTDLWIEKLQERLAVNVGPSKGRSLAEKYNTFFPAGYSERCSIEHAAADVLHIDEMSDSHPFRIDLYQDTSKIVPELHLKLYQFNQPIPLSDVLPMLENLGLRTLNEYPYEFSLGVGNSVWVSDFNVLYTHSDSFDMTNLNGIFQDAFIHILMGECENDGFNQLVLNAHLTWREVSIIRAYAKYIHQTRFRFSQAYIEKTLTLHANITKNLITLFKLKHDPQLYTVETDTITAIEADIQSSLEMVTSLDEDRILHRFWDLIKATLRTNYYQLSEDGKPQDYISLKLNSGAVPDLPLPRPLYEIFVYSPRFEGIHLRGAKVARGGIRWSDRREDFRTEVLGLMKAQKVKNAVIVPSGAKGGFVLKRLPAQATRVEVQSEVVACYTLFIRGLLDITDNILNDKVVRPPMVVCYDDEDTYLVVAADKGTASFSDIANQIANEYQFWLGDAFASGGSVGYDHKKIGITARGAWESIKRHFRELDISINETDITTVGIGDMSGDVFGNGMLYTNHIKLVAAFDHRHIFIDPHPDADRSYHERQRLFNLPNSSWEDYDASLISTGGGVYQRSSKSITITPEIKSILSIEENALPPNELIKAILKAPVDLLFNGGIGTYVKACNESHSDVGDKTNEFCRVNGSELRCKVVGEGGNLGFTQLGRVEFALQGGLINTDFIDNSAGVDCSDHEVNIKILLNKKVAGGELTELNRNELLAKMTAEVSELVLRDNYNQALVLSFSSVHSAKYSGLYLNNIKKLEMVAGLDRIVEFLPDDKQLNERKALNQGLTRPELAVLLAYTKMHIKNEILKSNVPENSYFISMLETAFPQTLVTAYYQAMVEHNLHREIIATQISNHVVNSMGITFAYRTQTETGASIAEIARAYLVSSAIFDSLTLQKHIGSLDFKIPGKLQYELLHHVRYLLNLSSRWFLHNDRLNGDLTQIITHYQACIHQLTHIIPELIVGATKEYLQTLKDQFVNSGLSVETARKVAISRVMYSGLNITEIATQHQFDLTSTAKVYFAIGGKFGLVYFRDQLASDNRDGDLSSLARLSLRDDLDMLQRQLTIAILNNNPQAMDAEQLINHWMDKHLYIYNRWNEIMEMLKIRTELDYTMFFIALRELSSLIAGTGNDVSITSKMENICHACKNVMRSNAESMLQQEIAPILS